MSPILPAALRRRNTASRFQVKRRALIFVAALLLVAGGFTLYAFNEYWKHRFDPLINRHASFYNLDADLVWSVIYEETYFRPWMRGGAAEVGLMQVTPVVAREWAAETGLRELARQTERDTAGLLSDPERNIQIGCWYLEKTARPYRDEPAALAKMLAAYNAGPSRVADWSRSSNGAPGNEPITEAAFIERIRISSTRAYVTSILERYRRLKDERAGALAAGGEAGEVSR